MVDLNSAQFFDWATKLITLGTLAYGFWKMVSYTSRIVFRLDQQDALMTKEFSDIKLRQDVTNGNIAKHEVRLEVLEDEAELEMPRRPRRRRR